MPTIVVSLAGRTQPMQMASEKRARSHTRARMNEQYGNDSELMRRIAQGDAGAFRTLSDRNLTRVVSFVYRLVRDHAEAEDIAQETFVRAWKNAARYEPKASVSTWLMAIAKNLAIDRLRKAGRNEAHFSIDDERDAAPHENRPSQLLGQKDRAQQLEEAISQLPERQAMALVLCHEQDMSNPEIAQVLECSVEAVESLLSRARRALRKLLSSVPPVLPTQESPR